MSSPFFLFVVALQNLISEGYEVARLEPTIWLVKVKSERYLFITYNQKEQHLEINRLFQYVGMSTPIDFVTNHLVLKPYVQNVFQNY